MGNSNSLSKHGASQPSFGRMEEEPCDVPVTPTPNTTTKSKDANFLLVDPRSPTAGISRTPVEVAAERDRVRQERMKVLQSLTNEQAQVGENNPDSGLLDPRSPTFDYKRTPILLDKEDSGVMETNSETTPSRTSADEHAGQVPSIQVSNPYCKDLRKRLFVSQVNDSITAATQDANKEN